MARTPNRKLEDSEDEGRQSDASDSDSNSDPNNETNPRLVKGPVRELIHENLAGAKWKIYRHQMCYIFDAVVPARQWKRGTVYTEEEPWAEYGPPPWPDLTETDRLPRQKPYYPRAYNERVCFILYLSLVF